MEILTIPRGDLHRLIFVQGMKWTSRLCLGCIAPFA
jgi:hypothetical protein